MMKFQNKTHCPKGHEFTPENTYIQKDGWKGCRVCRNNATYAYRERNKEKAADSARKSRLKNRESRIAYNKKYQKENPDKYKSYKQKRRAMGTEAGGSFTPSEWRDLCRKYDGRCLCCGRKKKLAADHVIPISKGGSSDISNIQPLCKSCNSRKFTGTTDFRLRFKK